MRGGLSNTGVLTVMQPQLSRSLINLNLTSAHSILNNMLSSSLPILYARNLRRILTATLSHSLNHGYVF